MAGAYSWPDDEVLVIHDDGGQFLALTGRHGYLTSVVTVDDARSFGRFRRLIARSATWAEAAAEAGKQTGTAVPQTSPSRGD